MVDGRVAVVAADDPEFWIALRREAAELAGRLLAVRSGRDCLRAIEDPRVRLVVLDSSLRDVAGMHLLHLVRRIRPDLGVIVTFEHSNEAEERAARQEGILYYGDRRGAKEVAAVLRQGLKVATGRSGNGGLPGAPEPAPGPEAGPARGTKESV